MSLTAQTFNGFLLTRNWRDARDGIELEFWFASDRGPLCALVRGERSVFFLEEHEAGQAADLLDVAGVELKPVKLQSFGQRPVVAVYCRAYRQARRLPEPARHSLR